MARRLTNAAKRPSAPAESIDALSFAALRSVAENPETSPQTLALLSRDPLLDVRVAVAWNPRTPAAALTRLADGPVEVQTGVAQNPAASAEVLGRLATHADTMVRSATATNPRLAYEVLVALTQDPDPEVRRTAENGVRAWEG